MVAEPILSVTNLSVAFHTDDGVVEAVNGVSFEVHAGEALGIVGESGAGKTVTAMALMGLLPRTAQITGEALYHGTDLLQLSRSEMRALQGNDLAMIFQDPMTALNPVFTIGSQLVEAIRVHNKDVSKQAARLRSIELLELVGIPESGARIDNYPHEFSGGMRQRTMIAMAIANEPELLIADEPTTALDVTIQAQVMEVIERVCAETGAAMMLITHDLGLVAGVADRINVMYGGRIFESGDTRTIFYDSRNPYTRGLMASIPGRGGRRQARLDPIPGAPPSPNNLPSGCVFRPRCPHVIERCHDEHPALVTVEGQHRTRCHVWDRLPPLQTAGAAS